MEISEINAAIIAGNYTNDQLTSIQDAVKFARGLVARETRRSITLGTSVEFTDPRTGITHRGTVNKIKIKNILVNCTTYGRGGLVNVPASMLTVV
jgi:hypothetical protein